MYITRGKNKHTIDYGAFDIYKFYKKTCKSSNKEFVSRNTFTRIIKRFHEEICDDIIHKATVFKMPGKLGDISIVKYKPRLIEKDGSVNMKKIPINYKETLELWKEMYPDKTIEEIKKIEDRPFVRESNKHFDKFQCKWQWSKLSCNIPNHTAYIFIASRENKRKLAGAIKELGTTLNYHK